MAQIKLYVLTGMVLLAAEAAWLTLVAKDLFREHVGHLVRTDFLLAPAVVFYAVYTLGILVFAVWPGLEAQQFHRTAALGAFLGFLAYATFDLTSMAVFRDFPLRVVILDLAWGTFVTAAVASAAFGMGNWLGLGGR